MKTITVEVLEKCLPYGSGFDGGWDFEEKKSHILCRSSFHCLNENGYYVGWADFSVLVYREPEVLNPGTDMAFETVRFDLHFHGAQAQRFNQRFLLREYFEDTLQYVLDEAFIEEEG